jgi:hypothetical protein
MGEKMESEVISRRGALSLLGLAALSLALPTGFALPTVLMVSEEAEAQPAAQPAAPAAQTSQNAT